VATLIGDDGKAIECHEPRPGFFCAASHWTAEEAALYAAAGEYPARLLKLIRDEYERGDSCRNRGERRASA
jgi:hypothetical protein